MMSGCCPLLSLVSYNSSRSQSLFGLIINITTYSLCVKGCFYPRSYFTTGSSDQVCWPLSLLGGSHSLHAPHRGEALDMVMFTIIL